MDLKGAKRIVLAQYQYPKQTISKSYYGNLGDDSVFGFIVGDGYDNHFVIVYSDGEMREITGPLVGSVARSLKEVQ